MLNRFITIDDFIGSGFVNRISDVNKTDRVLKSTKLESTIYKDLRSDLGDDSTISYAENEGAEKLKSFKSLVEDTFQSFYGINNRFTDEQELSTIARKFNSHILSEIMNDCGYGAIKSICEGRELPSIEATSEFIEQLMPRLDDMLSSVGGDKDSLNVLDKLENQQEALTSALSELLEQRNRMIDKNMSDNELDKKILEFANKVESKNRQIEALGKMVDTNMLKNKEKLGDAIAFAVQSAKEKAEDVQSILNAWGNGVGNGGRTELNKDIIQKVRQSTNLKNISKYLGRYKEMITQARKNGFAFGRGEKYDIELGNNLNRIITSEFALLASNDTIPLFLKKYQNKDLKQYRRREAMQKGCGDIIVCLDESDSTSGDRIALGKAVALSLLEIARINKRSFAMIHFSSAGQYKTDVFLPNSYLIDDIINSAETFLGGGTDYETPLTQAMELITIKEFQNADVVFITDGECAISESFAVELQKTKCIHNFTVTGILLDKGTGGINFSLTPICDKVYRTSEIMGDDILRNVI